LRFVPAAFLADVHRVGAEVPAVLLDVGAVGGTDLLDFDDVLGAR
jgi:hypothetical protein